MLLGEYNYSVDAKGRLFIPARFRDEMGSTLILSKSLDNCINVYSAEKWQQFVDKLDLLPEVKARSVKRYIFSTAMELTADAQGRIVLSAKLREHADLDKEAVIIGVGDHAEIWNTASYEAYMADNKTDELVETLTEYGI